MPKPGKSSATSATRKKHQKKVALALGIDVDPSSSSAKQQSAGKPKNKEKTGRGKKDGKKEPRVKAFIPPVKPVRSQLDPLDAGGLARRLPPDLVVILRNVGKKAQVTKIRALEELGSVWVERVVNSAGAVGNGDADGMLVASLVEMIPAWMHYIPSLFIHPSRRVRLLAISVHLDLLKIPEIRDHILFYLKETATSDEVESVLGSWCVLVHDIEKSVASIGKKAWDSFVRYPSAIPGGQQQQQQQQHRGEGDEHFYMLNGTSRNAVFGFVQRAIMDPLEVYNYLNPSPTSTAPTPPVFTNSKNQRSVPGGKGGTASRQRQLADAIVAARKTGTEEEHVRSRIEEYDESEVDRKARLRIGGLGGFKWFLEMDKNGLTDEVLTPLKNPLMWTVLYHGQNPPFVYLSGKVGNFGNGVDGFGFGQPNLRKAGWGLLMELLDDHKAHMAPLLQVLSLAVLRSAWVEPDTLVQGVMWQPLLTFIKEFPNCWNVELESSQMYANREENDLNGDDSDDEGEGEGEGENEGEGDYERAPRQEHQPPVEESIKSSLSYQEFLQFLQLGCLGSPVQGYPTVVVVLSTIPSSIMASSGTKTPVEDLFTSLWAALDGRALSSLHRAVTSSAFLSAVLECAVFMSRRIILERAKPKETRPSSTSSISLVYGETETETPDFHGATRSLIRSQFGKVWEEIKNGRLKVEERAAARIVARNLNSLQKLDAAFSTFVAVEDTLLRNVAWSTLKIGLQDTTRTKPGLVTTFLKVLFDHHRDDTHSGTEVANLAYELLMESMQRVDVLLKEGNVEGVKEDVRFLECMFDQFREGLFDNEAFAQGFDELSQTHAALLLEFSPELLFSYFAYRKDEGKVLDLWHVLLSIVVANSHDLEKTRKTTSCVIQAIQKGGLPAYLKPRANELDDIVGNLLGGVLNQDLSADAGDLEVLKAILDAHDHFVSENSYANLIETIGNAFNMRTELLLGGSTEDIDLAIFTAPLELLDLVLKRSDSRHGKIFEEVLPNMFLFSYLVPKCAAFGFDSSSNVFGIATRIWEREVRTGRLGLETRTMVIEGIKVALKDLINDPQAPSLPQEILEALALHGQKLDISLLRDIFPSADALNGMLRQLPQDPIDNSIAVTNPLVPPKIKPPKRGPKATDSRGFSSYARTVVALLQVFSEDRTLAKGNLWALRHFIALSIYAGDYQKVPAGVSPVFDAKALAGLGEIIGKVQQITAYLLLGSLVNVPDGWRRSVVKRVGEGNYSSNETGLERFVMDMMRFAVESDGVLDTSILGIVLEDVLDDIETQEAEEWIGLARKLETRAPQTSMTLIKAITETEAEPMRLDRYRNEQAAELLGIKPGKVNTDGLLTLRRLAASAPNMESDVVFLPQNRAVNVVKACQEWITSDDADVEEEVESAMTLVFAYLAPILQSVPGSHWDLIWDVLENNLENSSITDDGTLATLARSLRLVVIMEDLVKTNKPLRAEWELRRKNVLQLIRDMALVKLDIVSPSLARSTCRELVLTILKDLPESLMDESTLSKMCHLVTDHSIEVQKLSYGILRSAARKRTEYLVVEAGVDTESASQSSTIPAELFDIVQRHVSLSNLEDEDEQQAVFGMLLGWMLIFDLFQDASFKVKSRYIEQLRNLELLSRNFIPLFLTLLSLELGLEKTFKLDVWSIQEYHVDLFELGNPISISLLSAHLYYRALLSVPSLVYSWLSDCKDRQLTTAVTTYTSQHFSPVIIEVELAHVKGPAGQELTDDNMTVKVAAATNEVLASYLVDDHQLEIKLKIPQDWPLHKIEVKDSKRVGVDKDRWRAWILAVQQTIWSHNGRITDGLSLFKKNATLHFEGQVECAICYSIISVTDGSLPKKPCKTCKNKFHAGCLYKWFHTSNTSSCPLCRTEILLA